jgi:acyl-CoA synthetase (AMP-forming)/AMP-acid ligase II
VHQQVEVHRYLCLKCKRPFRVYPRGVTHAHSSDRVKGLAVMLYMLGLSYGAVSLALDGLGVPLSKTRVYEIVQVVALRIPDLKREQVFQGVKTPALGADLTSVKCAGQWLHLGLSVDALTGVVLTIDARASEDAAALKAWIEPIANSVGAQVLVTDDADGFKSVANESGLLHQVCKSHVKRNTEGLIDEMRPLVAANQELIKYKAFSVAPAQVEALLLEHPAVVDVAVIAKPDEEAGEVPKAFVVLRTGYEHQSANELMAWANDKLATYKNVREIEFTDAIPRNPSGKILRRILKEQERRKMGLA